MAKMNSSLTNEIVSDESEHLEILSKVFNMLAAKVDEDAKIMNEQRIFIYEPDNKPAPASCIGCSVSEEHKRKYFADLLDELI